MRHDADRIVFTEYYKQGNYYVALTRIELYPEYDNKKLRGGPKFGYVVSVINSLPKPGEHDAYCKRIRKKKDAEKYYQSIGDYCRSYGGGGWMNLLENIDKYFPWKIIDNKDYYIATEVIVSEVKQDIAEAEHILKELNFDQK